MAVNVFKYSADATLSGDDVNSKQTALTAAVAAAQLIGAGDASAEIDAVDAAVVAAQAAQASGVTVIVETTITHNQLVAIFENLLRRR